MGQATNLHHQAMSTKTGQPSAWKIHAWAGEDIKGTYETKVTNMTRAPLSATTSMWGSPQTPSSKCYSGAWNITWVRAPKPASALKVFTESSGSGERPKALTHLPGLLAFVENYIGWPGSQLHLTTLELVTCGTSPTCQLPKSSCLWVSCPHGQGSEMGLAIEAPRLGPSAGSRAQGVAWTHKIPQDSPFFRWNHTAIVEELMNMISTSRWSITWERERGKTMDEIMNIPTYYIYMCVCVRYICI